MLYAQCQKLVEMPSSVGIGALMAVVNQERGGACVKAVKMAAEYIDGVTRNTGTCQTSVKLGNQ